MKQLKSSVTKQITVTIVCVLLFVIGAYMVTNTFFLSTFFQHTLESKLVEVYDKADSYASDEGISSKIFEGDFAQLCSVNNINVVVLNRSYGVVLGQNDLMAARLWGYTTQVEVDDAKILTQNDQYTVQKKSDPKVNMDYLELWGTLNNGYYVMLRIPMGSIAANAATSNEFLLYITIVAVFIGVIVSMFLSRRITKPIRELTDLSRRMADLDFDAKYTSGGSDEIGQLGEHFNRMSETLEKTISELKSANNELQRDLERKDQMEKMRTEFLSNVSHELKTPLALISGYSEGLKECVNDDADSRDFYCDVIMDEAAKMTNMVKKLLTLNELEFGKDNVTMERFDLAALIRGKAASSKILADAKEASIEADVPDELHAWGDEFKVEEVLTNYISNALNHVDGEKKIVISCKTTGDKIRTTVYNTGVPIPEDSLDKVWGKFYKVDKARTREYGGSGVGLSIVKAIMDSFHQRYGVENMEEGVAFWFELDNAEGRNETENGSELDET